MTLPSVIPAQAGTHLSSRDSGAVGTMGSRLRGNDGFWVERPA